MCLYKYLLFEKILIIVFVFFSLKISQKWLQQTDLIALNVKHHKRSFQIMCEVAWFCKLLRCTSHLSARLKFPKPQNLPKILKVALL